jgi:hypothetical protein
MASQLLAGTLFFSVDGVRYSAIGEFAYRPSGVQRETLKGQDGVHGFKALPSQGRIEGKIRDKADVSVAALNALEDATVVLELANGKTVIGRNMWQVGEDGAPKVSTDEAEIDFALEGPDVRD